MLFAGVLQVGGVMNLIQLTVENEALAEAKQHLLFHHHNASGWITLAKKERDGGWRQHHFLPDQLATQLGDWLGEDVYFSQNTFYKPGRSSENIKELRALYVDIDCYNLGLNPHAVAEKLNQEVFQTSLPKPNMIIFSGRGLVCIWLIEPVSAQAIKLWQAIQHHFCEQLSFVGADRKSLDPSRVFRIAGGINSKSQKEVAVQFRHDHRYVLQELKTAYLPKLQFQTEKKDRPKPRGIPLKSVRSLYYTRLRDIKKLTEMRQYDVEGHRERLCFLYRYWSLCLNGTKEHSLDNMLVLNSAFRKPIGERVIERATKSAENAWEAKSSVQANEAAKAQGYPGAGYNLKNTTIISWLSITHEEQRHLWTIIGFEEKRRRKREHEKLKNRAINCAVSREEYLKQEREKTENRLQQLGRAINDHPEFSNRKLAEHLAVSEAYIRKLKKMLQPAHRYSPLY